MSKRISVLRCVVGFALAAVASTPVRAQSDPAAAYPSRPVRIIVGFAAGGGTDLLARLVSARMFRDTGQPVIVENRPGAGSMIAAELVAKAPPDGYTLFVAPVSTMTVNPAVFAKLRYAPSDFAPISIVSSYPYILVVTKSVPVRNMRELIDYAKANPAKANYAGSAPMFQIMNDVIRHETGAAFQYVSYKSSNESVTGVMSGEVLMTLSDAPPLTAAIRGDKVTAVAVSAPARIASFPDIPTMAELGLASLGQQMMGGTNGQGVFAPAATPPAIVEKLQNEVMRITRLPEFRERLATVSSEPVGNTSEEFRRIVASELERWTRYAKAGNIRIEQ